MTGPNVLISHIITTNPYIVFSPEELTTGCLALSACLGVRLWVRPWWPQPNLSATVFLHILFTATSYEQVRCSPTWTFLFGNPSYWCFTIHLQEILRFLFCTRWNVQETAAVSACAQWRPSNMDSPYSFAKHPFTCNRRAPCSTSSPCQWSPHLRTSSLLKRSFVFISGKKNIESREHNGLQSQDIYQSELESKAALWWFKHGTAGEIILSLPSSAIAAYEIFSNCRFKLCLQNLL